MTLTEICRAIKPFVLGWIATSSPVPTVLPDHDHSGDAGDGAAFDAANLTSGTATATHVLTADGAGNADWAAPAGGTVDAGDVTFTPTTATDWDSDADPGDVDNALDQLAERVDDLEAGGVAYAQVITVAQSGGDFASIQDAIDSVLDAASDKRYLVRVMPGDYNEQVTMTDWVDVRGAGKHATRITFSGDNGGAIILSDWSQVEDLLIETNTTATEWAIVGDNVSNWHIRNVDILSGNGANDSQGIKVTGTSWATGFIEHCVMNLYTKSGWGIYLTSDGDNVDVTINDVFLDTWSATTGGGVYISNAKDIQIRNSHFRTSAAGNCVEIDNAGSEVEIAHTIMQGGNAGLQINAGTVLLDCCSIDTVSGTWTGVRHDRDSSNLQISDGTKTALLGTAEWRTSEHASAPGTPAAGFVSVYAKADGKLYSKDDAGTEYDLTDGGGAVDAGEVTYTPTTATDWDSDADPGDVDGALDQLAERVDDLEGAGYLTSVDAAAVTYTPTTAADWDGSADPGDADNALDQLAERVADLEGAGGGGDVATDAIWDAKGDLAAGTGANTAARVAVGSDGTYLKANSGAAAGVSWDTPGGSGDILWSVIQASQLINEVKGYPAMVGIDVDLDAAGQWWDKVGTPTTAVTMVDLAGEAGITETWEYALKTVCDAASEGFYQRFTYADEPRVKAGRMLSAIAAVWVGTAGTTVTMKLVTSAATEVSATATAQGWTIITAESLTLDGTYVDLQFTTDTADTFYVVPLGVNLGEKAVPLKARGLRYRDKSSGATIKTLTGLSDEATWTDIDCTSDASALAVLASCQANLVEATDDYILKVGRNGASDGFEVAHVFSDAEACYNFFQIILDDANIFEYYLDRVSGAGALGYGVIVLAGWWEWE